MMKSIFLFFALVLSGGFFAPVFNARAQMATNGSTGVLARDGASPAAGLARVSDSNFPCDTSGGDDLDQPSGIIPTPHVQVQLALGLLSEFKTSKSFVQLQCAMRAMELVGYPDTGMCNDPIIGRREQAKMWLQLLATIEKNIGPHFDPKEIEGPTERAKYGKPLQGDEETVNRYIFQTKLHRLDVHASFDAENFLKRFYTSSPADKKELDGLLTEAGLSAPRIQKLKAALLNQ